MTAEGRSHLKTGLNDFLKSYCVYDVSLRVTDIYEAQPDAINGAPCMRTQLTYDGSSTRIVKRKESVSAWNSTWDL